MGSQPGCVSTTCMLVPMDVRLGDEFADGLIAWLCINHMYISNIQAMYFLLWIINFVQPLSFLYEQTEKLQFTVNKPIVS